MGYPPRSCWGWWPGKGLLLASSGYLPAYGVGQGSMMPWCVPPQIAGSEHEHHPSGGGVQPDSVVCGLGSARLAMRRPGRRRSSRDGLLIGPEASENPSRPPTLQPMASSTHRNGSQANGSNSDGSSPATVEGSCLCHWYGEGEMRRQVLADVDLSIHPGEVVLLTGHRGCGMTTPGFTLVGGLRSGSAVPKCGCWGRP